MRYTFTKLVSRWFGCLETRNLLPDWIKPDYSQPMQNVGYTPLRSLMVTHLTEYLEYYGQLKNPGYAVLVTGAWGIGKTWQVKNTIPEEKLWYVSLYRLSSVQQIDAAIFAAAHPTLDILKSFAEIHNKTLNKVGGNWGGFISDVLGDIARQKLKPNEHILVLDDLERSSINLEDLLGCINQYVEHRGFRVVVIAHDKKLKKIC